MCNRNPETGTFLARPNAKTHTPQRKTCLHLLPHPRKSSRSARRRPRPWPTKKSHNALLVAWRHYASRPRRNRSEIWRKATWKVTNNNNNNAFLFFFFARRISNVARFLGKGRGRVVAGGLVGRARKNASIEGISDAVVDDDDDDDDAFFYDDDDDDDDDDDLFDSSFPKRRSLVFGRDENTPRPHFVSFLRNRCFKSETTCDVLF